MHEQQAAAGVLGGRSRSEAKVAAAAENLRKGRAEFVGTDAQRQALAKAGQNSRIQTMPREDHVRGGTASEAQRWRCDDCGRISSARGIANHQRFKYHTGRTRVDNITEENA